MKKTSSISAFSTLKAFNVRLVNYLKTKCNIGCPVKLIFVKKERAKIQNQRRLFNQSVFVVWKKREGKLNHN